MFTEILDIYPISLMFTSIPTLEGSSSRCSHVVVLIRTRVSRTGNSKHRIVCYCQNTFTAYNRLYHALKCNKVAEIMNNTLNNKQLED